MNKSSIATARDADLRLSVQALERAALRAREVARQTGTAIVVRRGGVTETLHPRPVVASTVQEPVPPYGTGG
jgi:hypothetical protein